jgi:hypothetical protein
MITLAFTAVHFFFEDYVSHLRKYKIQFISFSSGLFITYIFLSMIPKIVEGTAVIGENVYFILLLGFVAFHIAEKYVFRHTVGKKNLTKRLTHIRTSGFFVNHFVLGIVLVLLFRFNNVSLIYLSVIPILFHIISSSLVIEYLHKKVRKSFIGRLFSSGSIFLGALFASLVTLPEGFFYGVLALITGILFYIVVRDVLPKYSKGSPKALLLGMITYIVLVLIESLI